MSLRVLCAIANPAGLPPFDDARAWREIEQALQPLTENRTVIAERASSPSETALRELLAAKAFDIVHFVGHAQAHAANYGTLALAGADGRSRNISARALADVIHASASVRLLILEACDDASFCFETIAGVLAQGNLAVAMIPALDPGIRQTLLAKLYAGALAGCSPEALTHELRRIAPGETSRSQVVAAVAGRAIFAVTAVVPFQPPVSPVEVLPNKVAPEPNKVTPEQDAFDVFLCHNNLDKPAVKRIARRLKDMGIRPWLDEWELRPGQPWQRSLEAQIASIACAAVFVGSAGIGPWQTQEIESFLREFVERQAPVIPVLLPDAPAAPILPVFLRGMTWVDFRSNDPDPLTRLIWGITGKRPRN